MLLQTFIPVKSFFFSFNDVSWSISDEMFFYACFPLLILFYNWLQTKGWLLVSVLLVGAIPILSLVLGADYTNNLFYVNPLFRIFDFSLGILLFYHTENKVNRHAFLWQLVALVVFLVFFLNHQSVDLLYRKSWYYWIPIVLVVYSFATGEGVISKLLSNSVLVTLGEISFGFYMFHRLVFRYFLIGNARFLHMQNIYVHMVLVLVISIGISYLSFYFYEKPARRFVHRILGA